MRSATRGVSAMAYILRQGWRYLAHTKVAVILILMVLLLAALASCFPQLSPAITADAERLARWEAAVRARYGPLTSLLAASGAFQLPRAPVFLASVALLALATLACTLQRWRALWRRAFYQPVSCSEAVFDGAPYATRLSMPDASSASEIVRRALRRCGFRTRSEKVGDIVYLRGDHNRFAPLGTLLTHLAVLLLVLGVAASAALGWRRELTIGPGETVEIKAGSGWVLRNDGFDIVRYPDGNIAAYRAAVAVGLAGQGLTQKVLEVNRPLAFKGVQLILSGYAEDSAGYHITLLAVRDPGYGVVIAAGLLLFLGMSLTFYLPHSCVQARIEPDGVVRLAGRADRRAYGFGREFTALVEELSRTAPAGVRRLPAGQEEEDDDHAL